MYLSSIMPFDNFLLSTLVASTPIIVFLLCLTLLKMKGVYAALTTLVITIPIATFVFDTPINISAGGMLEGAFQGLLPIGYIIIMAVWLYKISQHTGQFKIIEDSIAGISQDQRIQLLLIGFCFNAFLEGAAGFGVPIAVCAVLLIQLGFKPLQAAMLCLVANGASGAFGAIGIPIGIVDSLNLEGGITAMDVSQMSALILPFLAFLIPFLLIFILDGFKGIKEILPAILIVSVVYTGLQTFIIVFNGPELADIIPPLAAMVALAVLSRFHQPKNIFRLNAENIEAPKLRTVREVIYAWSPFYILTILVLIWSAQFFKDLFAEGGILNALVFSLPIPGTANDITGGLITLNVNIIGATGTAILLSALITIIIASTINFKEAGGLLGQTTKELFLPVITICLILAIARITTYGGLTNAMSQGIASVGNAFPIFSPILGWIGVFMTGSVVNNNTLFAPIQATVATEIGTSGPLLVAANTAGGVAAKLISPQSIAIATAAVQKVGEESKLLKMTLKYSLGMLVFICILTFILTLFI